MAKKEKVSVKKGVVVAKKSDATLSDTGGKAKKGVKERAKGKGKWQGGTDNGEDLGAELAALGLRIKEITGDGNCFFRALGDQLHGDEGAHVRLRQTVVSYIQEHEEDFAPFVEDDESFGTYVARMKKDGVWAGYMEVVAASRCLEANLTIYQAGQPRWRVVNHPEDTAAMLHLSYHDGQHYNSVRCADDYGNGPPAPVVIRGDGTMPSRPTQPRQGNGGWDERDERRVASSTACSDMGLVRKALEEAGGDVEAAIERVIEALAEAAPAETTDAVPAETTEPGTASAMQAAAAVPLEASGTQDEPSGSAEATVEPAQEQEEQRRLGATTAAAVDNQGGAAARTATAAVPAASGVECPEAAAATAELGKSSDGAESGSESAGCSATAAAVTSYPDAGGPQGPGAPAAEGAVSTNRVSAGSKKAAAPARKSEVRKGVGGASNNKRCPCGSNKKYKACCGPVVAATERRRAAAAGNGLQEDFASGTSVATTMVAQMASLVI